MTSQSSPHHPSATRHPSNLDASTHQTAALGQGAIQRLTIRPFVAIQTALVDVVSDENSDRGQSTAEYAMLLLGAAAIGLLVLGWATGTGKIGELFDSVVDSVIGQV